MDATGPQIGVCFHRPQSERDIKKLSQSSERGKNFFQLLELVYEKFPHITTVDYISRLRGWGINSLFNDVSRARFDLRFWGRRMDFTHYTTVFFLYRVNFVFGGYGAEEISSSCQTFSRGSTYVWYSLVLQSTSTLPQQHQSTHKSLAFFQNPHYYECGILHFFVSATDWVT
mgnify:CR=1 FL=1